MVELGETAERARHHPPGVEQDEDPLLPLGLVLDTDRTAAAGRRRPRDGARVVVGTVLAQALEHGPGPGHARATLTRVVGEATTQSDLVAADLLEVRVHVDRRRGGRPALALHEAERPARAEMNVAEPE